MKTKLKHSQYNSIFAFFLIFASFGCKIQKDNKSVVIPAGQKFYSYSSDVGIALNRYESTRPLKASIKEDGDALYITLDTSSVSGLGSAIAILLPPSVMGSQLSDSRALTYPPTKYLFSSKESGSFDTIENGTLKYRHWKPYIQAVAVAVKFRGRVGNALEQAEAGSTFALAGGFKHSWVAYKGKKDALGLSSRTISTSLGVLIGGGTTDIKASTTQGAVPDTQASKNFIIPVGLHAVFGFNNINLGLTYGTDIITGPNRTNWNYFKKPWVGIIIGLDILK